MFFKRVRNLISLKVKPLKLFKANTFNNNNKNLNGSKMSSSSCYMAGLHLFFHSTFIPPPSIKIKKSALLQLMWEQFSSGWFREKLYLITSLAVYQNHVLLCKLSSVKTLRIRRAHFHLLRDSLKSAVSEWLHRCDIHPHSIDVFKQTGCQPIERCPSARAGFFKRRQIYRRGNLQWCFTQYWHSK